MDDRILGAILAVIGLVSLASLGAILLFIPPQTSAILVPILFSFSLFLVLGSGLMFLGMRLRRRYLTDHNRQLIFAIAFREGALAAFLFVGYLWLAHFSFVRVWTILVPVTLFLAIEYYFLTRNAHARTKNTPTSF